MANAMTHLYENGISHGDVYAHNTMINEQADVLFGDFGAATNLNSLPKFQREAMERIEVRAFACLLDDLLQLNSAESVKENQQLAALTELKNNCMSNVSNRRPSFVEIQLICQALMQEGIHGIS